MSGPSYNINGDVVVNMVFDKKIMLLPIPQDAMQNNKKLTQNPGY